MKEYNHFISDDWDLGREIYVAISMVDEERLEEKRSEKQQFNFFSKPLALAYLALWIVYNFIYLYRDQYDITVTISSTIGTVFVYILTKGIEWTEKQSGSTTKYYDELLDAEDEMVGIFDNGIILGPFITGEDHKFVPYNEIEEIDMKRHRPIEIHGRKIYAIRVDTTDGRKYNINWEEFIYQTLPIDNIPLDIMMENYIQFYDNLKQMKEKHRL